MNIPITIDKKEFALAILKNKKTHILAEFKEQVYSAELFSIEDGLIKFIINNDFYELFVSRLPEGSWIAAYKGLNYNVSRKDILLNEDYETYHNISSEIAGDEICSPMNGKVVKILTKPDKVVKTGETLMIIEAMKMENNICSVKDGVIEAIHVAAGQNAAINRLLISYKKELCEINS